MTKRKASTPPLTDEEEARIQVGIAQDPDNPEITAEQFGEMRPASEVLPQGLFQALTKRGRPPAENKAVQVTLRVPPAVLDGYKAGGPGWQTRMNDALEAGLRGGRSSRTRTVEIGGKSVTGLVTKVGGATGRYTLVRPRAAAAKPRAKPEKG
jgi:uncharacterized protein (DUF4415 family)